MAKNGDLLQRPIRPERFLALGFLGLILAGAVLLALPVSSAAGVSIGLFESLFTATSAVCVTGLVAVDTGTVLSGFGQAVLLLLIQTGGLGFMIFATLIMMALGRRITLKNRMLIRESMSVSTLSGLMHLTAWYGALALGIELTGALLLAIRFIPAYGWGKGLWFSLFHAVSAFCNAGFDLMGNYSSLTAYQGDPLVLSVIAVLIILGGLGFSVMMEALRLRSWKQLSLHAKVALTASAWLLAAGTVFFLLTERWEHPLMSAVFQSVTMRTAGFNSVDLAGMTDASKLLSVILMFIGASPASTGGGVKTTTMSVLLLIVLSVIRGEEHVNVYGRRLPSGMMRRALSILFIYLAILLGGVMILTMAEGGRYALIDLLFEAVSALATVGVSSIGTPQLSMISRITLMLMMYFGRVGPLTLAFALASRQDAARSRLRLPEEDMMIG